MPLVSSPSRRLVLLAGIALVVIGVLCLTVSAEVTGAGTWWQGTLDAFGVGFVVGGIVDVTAISLLNQMLVGGWGGAWRERNNYASVLLAKYGGLASHSMPWLLLGDRAAEVLRDALTEVRNFINSYADAIDPLLRVRIVEMESELSSQLEEVQVRALDLDPPIP